MLSARILRCPHATKASPQIGVSVPAARRGQSASSVARVADHVVGGSALEHLHRTSFK
jgi:hypothetical protein